MDLIAMFFLGMASAFAIAAWALTGNDKPTDFQGYEK